MNRDLKQRVRPVSGLVNHKQAIKTYIKLAAKIIQNVDNRWGLWKEDEKKDDKSQVWLVCSGISTSKLDIQHSIFCVSLLQSFTLSSTTNKVTMITDECWELGSCPLLRKGMKTQNLHRKIRIPHSGQTNICVKGFRHAEFKSSLRFWLFLFLEELLATYFSEHMRVIAGFWVILCSLTFQHIRPCSIVANIQYQIL